MTLKPLFVALTLSLVAVAVAADPTGTWSGSLKVDTSKIPADQRKQAQAEIAAVKVTMVFRKDHTFVATTAGSNTGRTQRAEGTWSQKGGTVTIVTKTRDSKPVTNESSQQIVMGKDGNTMVMTIVAVPRNPKPGQKPQSGPVAKVVFTKKG